MTSDLGQAEAVRLGNGTPLPRKPSARVEIAGSRCVPVDYGNMMGSSEGDIAVGWRCYKDLRRGILVKGLLSRP